MLIRVDESSDRPMYLQIADAVRGELISGRVGIGSVLPPARVLAQGLSVNVHTVLRAYQHLRDEGLIDLRRRRGAVVLAAAGALLELREDIAALVARAARVGVSAETLAALVARTADSAASDGGSPELAVTRTEAAEAPADGAAA